MSPKQAKIKQCLRYDISPLGTSNLGAYLQINGPNNKLLHINRIILKVAIIYLQQNNKKISICGFI
jgi:hypothetical protein